MDDRQVVQHRRVREDHAAGITCGTGRVLEEGNVVGRGSANEFLRTRVPHVLHIEPREMGERG